VDAIVLLLGLPIFTKHDVGSGYAAAELGQKDGQSAIGLHFAAASSPGNAAGLNRFGALYEIAVQDGGNQPRLEFAGLITRSNEQSLEQGREALRHSEKSCEVTVARGSSSNGRTNLWTERSPARDCRGWNGAWELLQALAERRPATAPRCFESGNAVTFLLAMRNAALCTEPVSRHSFFHDGEPFTLEVRRKPGDRIEGAIRNRRGAKTAEFHLTYPPGETSGLPIRIEYRAKPFLKLVFDASSSISTGQPAIPSLFQEETA
jgi:hypothetical protein